MFPSKRELGAAQQTRLRGSRVDHMELAADDRVEVAPVGLDDVGLVDARFLDVCRREVLPCGSVGLGSWRGFFGGRRRLGGRRIAARLRAEVAAHADAPRKRCPLEAPRLDSAMGVTLRVRIERLAGVELYELARRFRAFGAVCP